MESSLNGLKGCMRLNYNKLWEVLGVSIITNYEKY